MGGPRALAARWSWAGRQGHRGCMCLRTPLGRGTASARRVLWAQGRAPGVGWTRAAVTASVSLPEGVGPSPTLRVLLASCRRAGCGRRRGLAGRGRAGSPRGRPRCSANTRLWGPRSVRNGQASQISSMGPNQTRWWWGHGSRGAGTQHPGRSAPHGVRTRREAPCPPSQNSGVERSPCTPLRRVAPSTN